MPDRDPRRLAAWAAAALILVAALRVVSGPFAARCGRRAATSPRRSRSRRDGAGGGRVIVDVAGAVKRPGVYRLSSSQRVEDALKRAGGATRRADLSQINRAAKLEDGRQILVPLRPSQSASAAAPGGRRRRPRHRASRSTSTPRRSSSSTRSTASARPRPRRSSTTAPSTAGSARSTSSTRSPGSARSASPPSASSVRV